MPQEDPTGPSAACRNNELLGEAADETAPRVARGLAAPSAPVQGTGEGGNRGGPHASPAPARPRFPCRSPSRRRCGCRFLLASRASPPPHCLLFWDGASATLSWGCRCPPPCALQHQREGAGGGSQSALLGCTGGCGSPRGTAAWVGGDTERLGPGAPLQDQSQWCWDPLTLSFPPVSTDGKRGAGTGFWGAAAPEGWRCQPRGSSPAFCGPAADGLCLPSTSERVQHGLSSALRFVSL